MRIKYSIFLLPILLFGCSDDKSEPMFRLLPAEESGVVFKNVVTSSADFNILEYLYFYNGGGVATGDINNDGLVDIFFTSNQSSNKLYLNKGNLQFEDITEASGLAGKGTWSTGVTMADVNADGLLDIYVSQVGDYKDAQGQNELFINNGDNTFTESAEQYGLAFKGFSTQAAFFDYDKDGDLDMYLLSHSIKNPAVFSEASTRYKPESGGDRFFQNQAAQGQLGFLDVTDQTGIYSSAIGFGLGLAVSDINGDHWPDIYISNDFTENDYLYINQKDGTFKEELEQRIAHTSRFSMGNDIADLDNDGLGEIITTDMLPSDPEIWKRSVVEDKSEVYKIKLGYGYGHQYVRNTLQRNLGNGQFSDLSLFTNNYASDWSWSPLIFDMDNDGFQDIHITNGIYKRPNDLDYLNYQSTSNDVRQRSQDELEEFLVETLPTVKIPNYAGRNHGGFEVEDVADAWGLNQPSYSNGSAYADLDNDGDLELIINNIEQEAFIYENLSKENAYLKVSFKGPSLNPFGIGTKVTLKLGDQSITRENFNSRGFQSSIAPSLHFGLGKAKSINELTVIWPDGKIQRMTNQGINQTLTIDYENAKLDTSKSKEEKQALLSPLANPFGFEHKEDAFTDFDREYLIPRQFNHEGPALAVADVNQDGLDDVYFGGARDQAGELWIQQTSGTFSPQASPIFNQLAKAEDIAAEFFDADNDGDQDLYVSTGGNESEEGQLFSYDRLYLNDGRGNFRFSPPALPQIGSQGKTIAITDIDGDGDLDVFVGSNIVSGAYGKNPQQYLLINNGRGLFKNEITTRISGSETMGMLNASQWIDYDQDGDQDLLVAGEWTPIHLYENDGSGVFSAASLEAFEGSNGWWYSLKVADINNDGLLDILAGNLGLNNKLKATEEQPVSLYLRDYDNNGQTDPFVFHYQKGIESPFATRDDLIKQMAGIKKLHPDYKSYAQITGPADLLGGGFTNDAIVKRAYSFSSKVFINKGNGKFEGMPLANEAQFSTAMGFAVNDLNKDGNPDLLVFGNNYTFRNDYGRSDAKPITLLMGNGDGTFTPRADSHLNTPETWGEYRSARRIMINGQAMIIAVRNNQPPILLKAN
ncbi:VCBS repeat-containing protein [Roseivirga sp. E12]|uniref:VCBS repeat-containing protein n=1 Tax=Roseivirga sp. E12 TaxID=2819237 RepID=UPI001ABC1A4F|nr:VCBS repeat-containing protein [Roseivirga sp. E12]MBO3698869.1 VCBS repeat-containing protein [Roseivirga sp. E12]